MKAREYAISKGLAKPGRGKLSFEAHEAIKQAISEGMQFSDYGTNKISSEQKVRVIKLNGNKVEADRITKVVDFVRQENVMSVTDEFGVKMNLDVHSECGKSIRRCNCKKGPTPPSWLGSASFELKVI